MEQQGNSKQFDDKKNSKRSNNLSRSQSSDSQNNSRMSNNRFTNGNQNYPVSILKQSFQELPVGKSATNNVLSQYPDDYQPTTNVVAEIQPLIKRVVSKVWKARQEAYSELEEAFRKGELLSQYEQFLNGFITDSNLQAQEKGFKILQAYVIQKQAITIQINPIFKSIIQKGLTNNKMQTVRTAQNVLVQLFDKGDQIKNKVISYITEGISNKNAKIASGSIDAIIPLLNNYGLTRLELLKPFLREIQKLNEATAPNIKTSITNFFKQAYKWLGEPVLLTVNKFKKALQDQIKAFTSTYKHQPMKPLRAKQSDQKIDLRSGNRQLDAYSFSDPVNVIDKFDQRWCQKTLQLIKWTQKKEAIDVAIQAFNVPKILNKQTSHLVSFITRLLADSNANVMISGLKLLRNLATGLRKNFYNGAKCIFKQILFKLRDKKQWIVQEVHKVLNALLLCMSLEEMLDKIKQNLTDKAPNMKIQTLNFIKNSMKEKKQIKTAKSLIDVLKLLMNDATMEVREKTLETLCKIKSLFGVGVLGNIDKWINVPKDKIMKIKNQPQVPPMEEEKNMNGKSSLNKSFSHTPNVNPNSNSNSSFNSNLNKSFNSTIHKSTNQSFNQNIINDLPQNSKVLNMNRDMQNIPLTSNPSQNQLNSGKKVYINKEPANYYIRINSPIQSQRYQTYNNLLFNQVEIDYFLLRERCNVQSSEDILKLIASLIERSFSSRQITKQALQFLVIHNWSNHQRIINNLLRFLKVNQTHYYIIQDHQKLFEIFLRSNQAHKEQMGPNLLMKRLYQYSLLFKIQEKKAVALKNCIDLVNVYQRIGQTPQDNCDHIGSIVMNLRTLLLDKNIQIIQNVIQLSGDLVRICFITKMKGKIIFPLIIKKIDQPRLEGAINLFLDKCLQTQSSYLLSQLIATLPQIKMKKNILTFIYKNLDSFVPTCTNDEIKSLLLAMVGCLKESSMDIPTIAQSIIDKLLNAIKESELSNAINFDHSDIPIKYKKKYRLDKPVINPRLSSKFSRIQTLGNSTQNSLRQLVPSTVNKLMAVLTQLPPPYNELASPMPINATLLDQLFTPQGFDKYSDLFVQWLFWRFHIQRAQNVLILIEVSKKILYYPLKQIELIVLLSGSLGALQLGQQVVDGFCSWSSIFYERGQQKDVFLFYINSLAKNQQNLDQIVKIIISSYSSVISEYLALISKTQILKKSKQFMRYLKQNYSNDLLRATGLCEMQSHPEIVNRSSHVHSVSSPIHHPPHVSRTPQKSFNKYDFVHYLISILNNQGLEKMKIALEKQSSSRSEQQRPDFNVEALILMMQLMKSTLQQQFTLSCFKEYANWFYSVYAQLKLQITQLQRIFRAVVEILSKFSTPTPTQRQNIIIPVNAFLLQIITIGDVRDLFYCVFEAGKQFQQKGQERNMINLVYIKSIEKIRLCNNFFKQNRLQTYKILLQHAVDYIAEAIQIYNPQNFTFKKIKGQILEYFNTLLPSSKQITIDVLRDNKSRHAVVQFFDYLFIHIRQNNPVMMEISQYQAMKQLREKMCTPEEVSIGSKCFQILAPQQIFEKESFKK